MATKIILKSIPPSKLSAAPTGYKYLFSNSETDSIYEKEDTSKAVGGSTPIYKSYTALLTQTSTNNPVATVLENTLGGAITFARVGGGVYTLTLSNAFTANKTTLMFYIDPL